MKSFKTTALTTSIRPLWALWNNASCLACGEYSVSVSPLHRLSYTGSNLCGNECLPPVGLSTLTASHSCSLSRPIL